MNILFVRAFVFDEHSLHQCWAYSREGLYSNSQLVTATHTHQKFTGSSTQECDKIEKVQEYHASYPEEQQHC